MVEIKRKELGFLDKIKSYFHITKFFLGKRQNLIEDYTYEKILDLLKNYDNKNQNSTFSERELFANIIELRNKRVQDIMIPRIDVVAIKHDSNFDDIMSVVEKSGYSRFPIYKDTLDDVNGFIHVKDIIPFYQNQGKLSISKILRNIIFISPYHNPPQSYL